MSGRDTELRPATPDEVQAERMANPEDFWVQVKLNMDERLVARAAKRLWGKAVRSGMEGEWLWRLWVPDPGTPAYLAMGLLPPAVLFSNGVLPDGEVREEIAAEVRRMLEAAGGEVPTRPLTPPPATTV